MSASSPIMHSENLTPPPYLKERYRLRQWLGQGSMGLVYRAQDEILGRDIAIKFLSPKQLADPDLVERFLREARTIARLAHPNILNLYDVGQEEGWHYLVLEYIDGRDLRDRLNQENGPLPLPEALRIVRDLLQALDFAHAQAVIHRDIKPENVLLTPQGGVKVADFGLALAQGDLRLTRDDIIVGTTLYLAPEVVAGQSPDHRADLYAVGAVMYEMLAGQPPFTGDNPLTVFSQILHAPITPPRQINSTIPANIEAIITKLLARDPLQRYASAAAVLAALPDEAPEVDQAAATEPSTVRQSSPRLPRILRHSTHTQRRPDAEAQDLFLYAALDDTVEAIEAERRRLAQLLQTEVVASLDLLLAQINAYEQLLGANPNARMAISVLASLARQSIQATRDLGDNLHPTILETLGLEPALESLVNQTRRAVGVQITLTAQRMSRRLPAKLELALFRVVQDALVWSIQQARATQITISLDCDQEQVRLRLADNAVGHTGTAGLQPAQQRIEQLGGQFKVEVSPQGGASLTIQASLAPPVQLTPREMEVIQHLTEGLSNKEIALLLSVSPRTVNFHLDNIYAKLGINSRTEAAIYALRQGWGQTPV
jgi:serine/threonine protein kinase/DNA-binding CsgD family transcriptional regulator